MLADWGWTGCDARFLEEGQGPTAVPDAVKRQFRSDEERPDPSPWPIGGTSHYAGASSNDLAKTVCSSRV